MIVESTAVSSEVYAVEPTCGLEFDVEYAGNDIGNAQAAEASDCCSLCEGFGGCRAFSWSEYEGGTCWFKNRKDQVNWETGVKSGQVVANPAAPSCALESGVEYVGNDIGNASSITAFGCCSVCMKTVGCRAFSWADLDGGNCYLKSEKEMTQVSERFVSAVV
ncbi:hypothetical protein PRIC1_006075 [Phytophthora ramorum]